MYTKIHNLSCVSCGKRTWPISSCLDLPLVNKPYITKGWLKVGVADVVNREMDLVLNMWMVLKSATNVAQGMNDCLWTFSKILRDKIWDERAWDWRNQYWSGLSLGSITIFCLGKVPVLLDREGYTILDTRKRWTSSLDCVQLSLLMHTSETIPG